MYVIVGLGNPGKEYRDTRHNIGFKVIDLLGERNDIDIRKIKFKSVYGEGYINGEKVILVKPQTYMNNSGVAIREIMEYFKIPMDKLLIIVDDIDIDFASIRIKKKGSAGSHNGLKSVIYQLKDDKFPRIKIGIGKRYKRQDLSDFVLSKFREEEIDDIKISIINAAEAVETIVGEDLNTAMNKYNIKSRPAQD